MPGLISLFLNLSLLLRRGSVCLAIFVQQFLHLEMSSVKLVVRTSRIKYSTPGIHNPVCSTTKQPYKQNHRNSWFYLTSWTKQKRFPCGHLTRKEEVSENLVLLHIDIKYFQGNVDLRGLVFVFEAEAFTLNQSSSSQCQGASLDLGSGTF